MRQLGRGGWGEAGNAASRQSGSSAEASSDHQLLQRTLHHWGGGSHKPFHPLPLDKPHALLFLMSSSDLGSQWAKTFRSVFRTGRMAPPALCSQLPHHCQWQAE